MRRSKRRWGRRSSARDLSRPGAIQQQCGQARACAGVCVHAHCGYSVDRRAWALPFLTVVAPSDAMTSKRGRKTASAGQSRGHGSLVRWVVAERDLIIVGDGTYAATALPAYLQHFQTSGHLGPLGSTWMPPCTAPPYAIPKGRTRVKGDKLPNPQHYVDDRPRCEPA